MKTFGTIAAVAVGVFCWSTGASANVVIDTVRVGNPGNAGELSGAGAGGYGPDRICGSVAYSYNIGRYEVTAGQYTEFLNAVASRDTYGLYNPDMGNTSDDVLHGFGCNIQRSGASGNYTYSVASEWAERPVNHISWGSSARFANWLHNGQPTGLQSEYTTEDGSYILHGATSDADLQAVTRKANATWAITNEDEWYKAAYYNPSTSSYFEYATSSNEINTGMANYNLSVGHTTDVGSYAYSSPYGTFDQSGNVWEWNEAVINDPLYGSYRGQRGGSFDYDYDTLHAAFGSRGYPSIGRRHTGFRVVEVPEPAALSLLALGGVMVLRRRPRTPSVPD